MSIAALGLSLAACGGGGSSTPTTATFPFATAFAAYNATASQQTLTVSGTALYSGTTYPVTGSIQVAQSAATSGGMFEGGTAVSGTQTIVGVLNAAGQAFPLSSAWQYYWTATYTPLGSTTAGAYCVAASAGQYPANVTLGDSGTVVSFACYADSTKLVPIGTETMTYSVTAGGSSSVADVTVTSTLLSSTNQLLNQIVTTYTVSQSGVLALQAYGATETISGVAVSITAK